MLSKMKRACELCNRTARLYCKWDQASLCWDCDAKVHSANFLVARHSRNLLCRVCQSPTPWSAHGSKLERAFHDCQKCVNRTGSDKREGEGEQEAAGEGQEVAENQVVPLSPSPPPPASDSSSGGEADATRKRSRPGNDPIIFHDLKISKPPSDTAAETASGADSTISRGTATQFREIKRNVPSEAEVEAVKKVHRQKTTSDEEKADHPINEDAAAPAVDLNLSLSLFKR